METDGVVFYSCNKTNFNNRLFEKIFVLVIRRFFYKTPYLYKRIHFHLDRQRFDWTKQA